MLPVAHSVVVFAADNRALAFFFQDVEFARSHAQLESVQIVIHLELHILADEFDIDVTPFGQRRAVELRQLPRSCYVVGIGCQRGVCLVVIVAGSADGQCQREESDFPKIFHLSSICFLFLSFPFARGRSPVFGEVPDCPSEGRHSKRSLAISGRVSSFYAVFLHQTSSERLLPASTAVHSHVSHFEQVSSLKALSF